jgi:hypothetical protein
MTTSTCSARQPSDTCDSLHHHLNMYALAASTAGVGMLALAQPAEAKIIYTPTHKWLPINQQFDIDLNHDGVSDFEFNLTSLHRSSYSNCKLTVEATAQSNEIYSVLASGRNPVPAALPKGTKIGSKHGFENQLRYGLMFAAGSSAAGNWDFGPWVGEQKQAYLGVRFLINGTIHYGWVRLGHVRTGRTGEWCDKPATLLTGYAYETVPKKPIIAGKTTGSDVIAVQPGSLGALAAGRR